MQVTVPRGCVADITAVGRDPGFRCDDSSIVVRFGSGASAFGYVNAGTGAEANLTNANWRMIVKARAR